MTLYIVAGKNNFLSLGIQLVPFRIIDVVNVWEFFNLTHSHSCLNYSIWATATIESYFTVFYQYIKFTEHYWLL